MTTEATIEKGTDVVPTCRVFGCTEGGLRFRYVAVKDEDDRDTGMLDQVWTCSEHSKEPLKKIRDKISGREVIVTPPSVAHDKPVPLSPVGQQALGSGTEDVTAVGLSSAPETLRAFRCPDGEWERFLEVCQADGEKPNLVLRGLIQDHVQEAADAGQDSD